MQRMIDDRRPTTVDLLTYLAGNVDWLAHRKEAVQAFDELTTACRNVRNVIDTAPELVFLGTCDQCGEALHAQPHDAEALCRACARKFLVSDRHQAMLDAADEHLETAAMIAAYMTTHGERIQAPRIRQWAKRRRLVHHGHDRDGHALYRVGDVRQLLREARKHDPKT